MNNQIFYTIFLFFSLLCLPYALNAQVTTDGNYQDTYSSSSVTAVMNNFTVPSGDSRVLIVSIGTMGDFPTTVTYGGTPMTQAILEDGAVEEITMWYLILGSGAAAGPSDIVASFSSPNSAEIRAVSFQNVDQTSIFGNTAQDSGNAPSSSLNILTSDSKNLVVDAFNGNTLAPYTPTHTLIGGPTGSYLGSIMGTGSTVTVQWATQNGQNSFGHAHVAIELICDTCAPSDVPTLSEWGLITLALLLMTLGTLYLVQPSTQFEQEG